jgi:hypothetical protein
MQPQPCVRQPFAELGDRASVPVVEVGACRENLDRVEVVRRDMDEVVAAQPRFMEEVGRDAEGANQRIRF